MLASKSHMLNFSKGVARFVLRCAVTATYGNRERRIQKYFQFSGKKRAKSRNKEFYNNDCRKVVIYNAAPDTLRDLHTSQCKRSHSRTYDGCLWKPAKRNKVRMSKQLQFVVNTEAFNGNQALILTP